MAIQGKVETDAGEDRELYIRLIDMDINNHGKPCYGMFRGFVSKDAFENGKQCLWEYEHPIEDVEVTSNLWKQAYESLQNETVTVESDETDEDGDPVPEEVPLIKDAEDT